MDSIQKHEENSESLLLFLPPELMQIVANFLDFKSLLALSNSHFFLRHLRPDYQSFSVTKNMLVRIFLGSKIRHQIIGCPVFFPVKEVIFSVTWAESNICPAKVTLVVVNEANNDDGSTILVCHKNIMPVSKGKSEDIVLSIGVTGSEGACMMLILEDVDPSSLVEVTVTLVNSLLDHNKKVKKAIPLLIRRLGVYFFVSKLFWIQSMRQSLYKLSS